MSNFDALAKRFTGDKMIGWISRLAGIGAGLAGNASGVREFTDSIMSGLGITDTRLQDVAGIVGLGALFGVVKAFGKGLKGIGGGIVTFLTWMIATMIIMRGWYLFTDITGINLGGEA